MATINTRLAAIEKRLAVAYPRWDELEKLQEAFLGGKN